MNFPEAYDSAWLYYLGASIGLVALLWWALNSMVWRLGRILLLCLASAFLLVPYSVDAQINGSILAPAWLMAAMEGIFEGDFARAGSVLGAALVVACIVGLLIEVALRKFSVAPPSEVAQVAHQETSSAPTAMTGSKREPVFSSEKPELESV